MRVTKVIIAKVCNEYFNKVELPFEVKVENIEHSRFNQSDIEAGATRHHIEATHKIDSKYIPRWICTMQTFRQMEYELKKFPNSEIKIKNYGKHGSLDLWIVID